MLSLSSPMSASQAQSYYTHADYYCEAENGESMLENRFAGKLADELGIPPQMDKDTFDRLTEGKVKEGVEVGRVMNGEKEHRAGWDLTFSAPKSVSILALSKDGDPRLLEAHRQAVSTVMKHVEENFAFTRRTENGETKMQKVDGLLYSQHEHGSSRALDPQLHTHNFLFNFANDQGQFRSIESKAIFDAKMDLGFMYRNELAVLCKKMGYSIEGMDKGLFELGEVPREVIDNFSKRRQEILEAAKLYDLHGGKELSRAALLTRQSKQEASMDDLQGAWGNEMKRMNFNVKDSVRDGVMFTTEKQSLQLAKDNLQISINHFAQFESAFSQKELIKFTSQHNLGDNTHDEYLKALNSLKKDGVIFDSKLTAQKGKEHFLVSHEALRKENLMLDLMKQGKDMFEPIYTDRDIQSHIDHVEQRSKEAGFDHGFTNGQAEAFKLTLSSKDQFNGINGRAGTGKTFMQKEGKFMLEAAGYEVTGYAPTGSAASKLEKEAGFPCRTIDSHLHKCRAMSDKDREKLGKQFWVVDEASLASTDSMLDLMFEARKQGARVMFQGDVDQLGSVEAGKAFALMIEHGLSHTEMREILRQKDLDIKDSVYAAIDRKYGQAFTKLRDRMMPNTNEKDLFNEWTKLSKAERDRTLIVIPDIITRDEVSKDIHEHKKQLGEIGAKDALTHVLVNNKFSNAQKKYGRFYQQSMVVEFQNNYKSLGVKQGDKYVVAQQHKGTDLVTLVNLKHVPADKINDKDYLSSLNLKEVGLRWHPEKVAGKAKRGVEVFNVEKRKFSKGEQVKWTKSDTEHKNGEKATVQSIDAKNHKAVLKFESGKTKTIDLRDPQTCDYNYVMTAYAAQGLDQYRVFMLAEYHRRNLVNQKSFYVKLSRATHDIKLFTNQSSNDLAKALKGRTGEKESAKDHAKQADPLNSSFMKNKMKEHKYKQAQQAKQKATKQATKDKQSAQQQQERQQQQSRDFSR